MMDWKSISVVWKSVSDALDLPAPVGKPWRVTRYRPHWYWGHPIGPVEAFDFRWYWQANTASWFWHHILGWSCNTWFYKSPAIEAMKEEKNG